MPIQVSLFQFKGYAFNPDDISFGDSETKDILINRNGAIQTVSLRKETVTFSLKGATDTDLQMLEQERVNNTVGLINGSVSGEDINILGKTIYNAFLYRVAPTGPITVNGITVFDSIEMEYRSPEFT